MKQIVILGGGTAGSIVSNRLYRQLPQNEYQITVVDRDNNHHYQPGYLFVPFGMYKPRTVVKKRSRFLPSGVRFVMDRIKKVDPVAKTVELENETIPLPLPDCRHRVHHSSRPGTGDERPEGLAQERL